VAYIYNDPVIFLDYAIDPVVDCEERGLKSVAVTAGYICDEPRRELFAHTDAANVDLKAFTEGF
jgi:pyruvate formate lyase activating enzyme